MNSIIRLIAITATLAAAPAHAQWQLHAEVGIAGGATPSVSLAGGNPLGVFRLRLERGPFAIEYEHQSSINDGPPMNNRLDQRWQERIGVFYRVTLK